LDSDGSSEEEYEHIYKAVEVPNKIDLDEYKE
jgi:hypothetical protein